MISQHPSSSSCFVKRESRNSGLLKQLYVVSAEPLRVNLDADAREWFVGLICSAGLKIRDTEASNEMFVKSRDSCCSIEKVYRTARQSGLMPDYAVTGN
jgi:hypothetical protein